MGIKEASEMQEPSVVALEIGETDEKSSKKEKKIGFATFATWIVHRLQPDALIMVYETLDHRLVVVEAAQKLRLHEEEIEKWSILSRSSLDTASTSFTISSASNLVNYANTMSMIL